VHARSFVSISSKRRSEYFLLLSLGYSLFTACELLHVVTSYIYFNPREALVEWNNNNNATVREIKSAEEIIVALKIQYKFVTYVLLTTMYFPN
jgi:hypothetical protein